MSLLDLMRDRLGPSLIRLAGVGVVALVLVGIGVEQSVIELVVGTLVACGLLAIVCEWLRRRSFWLRVGQVTEDDALAAEASAVVEEPDFLEGRIAWDAIDAITQAGRRRTDAARAVSDEYREFIDAWVHEVKTPIAASRLICENNPGTASRQIERELDRMDGFVEQALYYSRAGSLDRDYLVRQVRVGDVVNAAVRAHKRSLIDARVAVSLGEGMDLTAFLDAKWMVFILGQLIENAVKYRAPEGSGRQPRLAFSARLVDGGRSSECVELSVEDNGVGIPLADLPRVFDRGFVGANGRLEGQARSTGLGLYLVRSLCEKMGLSVSADSVQGAWTRVVISFPTERSRMLEP